MDTTIRIAHIDSRYRHRARFVHRLSSDNIYIAPFDDPDDLLSSQSDHHLIMIEYNALFADTLIRLEESGCEIPVVAYQESPEINSIVSAVRHGADDFIDISDPSCVHARLARISDEIDKRSNDENRFKRHKGASSYGLSARENDVMGLVAQGYTSKHIARILNISHRTVDAHRAKILKKLSAPRITNAVSKIALTGLNSFKRVEPVLSKGFQ